MSLINAVLDGFSILAEDGGGAPAPWDDFWYQPIGTGSSTGMRITAETAKRIACVYACVAVIGRMLGSFPAGVYREGANGSKKLAKTHPTYKLLATSPNPNQSPFEFRHMLQGHLELRGNAYCEIIANGRGVVQQLVPLHPDRVTPEQLVSGRIRYRYDDPFTNITRYMVQEEVFHLRGWSDDGIVGMSTVACGADTFGVALAAQEYSARFFQNDATPSGVIEGASFKEKADEDAFVESWQRRHTRTNKHKTAVLPAGLTYKEIGVKPSDAQLLDARKFSRIEICSMFGVPPHLIGETEKTATYASVEQFNIMFATQCLWPRLVNWEQTIWRDLIQDEDYLAKFSMAALLRGDTAARFAAYQIAIQNGWLSQNDVRVLEDLNPIADGDNYWRPMNWARLGDVPQSESGAGDDAENTEDESSSNDVGAGDNGQEQDGTNALRARLKLLASSGAERCTRKEMAAVRRLLDRRASAEEITSFYREHADFVADVLRLPVDCARAYCASHADEVRSRPDDTVLNVSDRWVMELTALALGEVQ
jgi:HK97 family phage portal protein